MRSPPWILRSLVIATLTHGCLISDPFRVSQTSFGTGAGHNQAGFAGNSNLPPSGGTQVGGGRSATHAQVTSAGATGDSSTAGSAGDSLQVGGTSSTETIGSGPSMGGSPESSGGSPSGGSPSGGSPSGGSPSGGSPSGGASSVAGASSGGFHGGTIAGGLQDCRLLLHMDEAAWNATLDEVKDSSGWQHHGTAVGAVTTASSPAKFGRSGQFNAAGYLEFGDEASLRPTTALTLAVWFYATGLDGAERGIVAKRSAELDRNSYSLFLSGGAGADPTNVLLYVDVDGSNDRFNSEPSRPIVANTWYHVVMTYDGSLPVEQRARLYVNGLLQGGARKETSSSIPATHDGPLQVGNLRNGGQHFKGHLDELAVWHRALSSSEVTAMYWASRPLR